MTFFEGLAEALALLFVLAVVAEMTTEVVKGWFEKEQALPKPARRYIALVVGTALSIYYTLQTGMSL